MNFIFVSILLTLSAGVRSVKDYYFLEEAETHFENFITKHGKVYKSEQEKLKRLEIFKDNLLEINRKNDNPDDTANYGINRFTDMTQIEFEAFVSGLKLPSEGESECNKTTFASFNFSKAPDAFDWRSENVVSPVKNQDYCRSCWAFSATGHLESQYAIKHKKMVLLSEQQLVDCVTKCGGCDGGYMSFSFEYTIHHGLTTEENYRYTSEDGECLDKVYKSAIKVTGCNTYDLHDEEELKELLYNKGPISVVVAVKSWKEYKHGIIKDCDNELDHALLLVGYGTENGTPYWILKNSWGDFGEEGYVRFLRGNNTCGLLNKDMATADVA